MLHATQNSVALWREASKCAMPHCCMRFQVGFHAFFFSLLSAHTFASVYLLVLQVCVLLWFVCSNALHKSLARAAKCSFVALLQLLFLFFYFCSCCCFIIVAADAVIRMHRSALVNSHAISARRWNAANAMPSDSHAMDARTQTHTLTTRHRAIYLATKKKLFAF